MSKTHRGRPVTERQKMQDKTVVRWNGEPLGCITVVSGIPFIDGQFISVGDYICLAEDGAKRFLMVVSPDQLDDVIDREVKVGTRVIEPVEGEVVDIEEGYAHILSREQHNDEGTEISISTYVICPIADIVVA